jgi:hypothetical protein
MSSLGQFFRALAELLGFLNRRTDLKNAPDVRAAAQAQQHVAARDAIKQSVARQDVKGTREDLAE